MGDHTLGISIVANAEQAIAGFDKTVRACYGAEKEIKQLGKEGSDTEAILSKIAARGIEGLSELAQAAKGTGRPIADIQKELNEANNAAINGAREASRSISEQAASYQAMANQVAAFGARLKSLTDDFLAARKEVAGLERELSIAFRDKGEAKLVAQQIKGIQLATGQTTEELLQGARTFEKFGQYSEQNMVIAANAAKRTGQSISTVSEAIAKFQKFGDERSARAVRNVLGIDPQEVAKEAGLLDAHGKLLLKNADDAAKWRAAMEKAYSTKFGSNIEEMIGPVQKFELELQKLKSEIGEGVVNSNAKWAASMIPVIQGLREMPEWMKQGIGLSVSMGSSLAGPIKSGLELAAVYKLLGGNITSIGPMISAARATMVGWTAAAAGFVGAGGAAVIAVAALGAATYAYTQQLIDNEKAEQDLLVMRERQFGVLGKYSFLVGQTAENLLKEGHTSKETASAILLLHEAREVAAKTGNTEEVAKIQARIDAARKQHSELAGLEQNKRDSDKKSAGAEKERLDEGVAAWNNYKQNVTAGVYETKEAQEKAFDSALAKLSNHGREWKSEELEKFGYSKKEAEDYAKASHEAVLQATRTHREGADERAKNEKTSLDRQHDLHEINTQQYISGLKQILAAHKGSVAERQSLMQSLAQAQAKANEESLRSAEKSIEVDLASGKITAQDASERYAALAKESGLSQEKIDEYTLKSVEKQKDADSQKLKSSLHVLETSVKNGEMTAEQESAYLNSILRTHKLTAEQRIEVENKLTDANKKAVQERHNHELALLHKRKAEGHATLEEEAALLEKQANDRGLTQEQRDGKSVAAAEKRKEIEDHRLSQQQALAKVQEELLKKEEGHLQERMGKGEDVSEQLIANKRKQYDMERAEIQRTAEEERKKYGETAEGQAILQAKLQDLSVKEQDDIRTVHKARQQYLKGILDKLEEIDRKNKEMSGFKLGAQSISEAFGGDSNLGFSLSSQKSTAPAIPNGMSIDQLRQAVAANPEDPKVASAYAQATSGVKNSAGVPTVDGVPSSDRIPRTTDTPRGVPSDLTPEAAARYGFPPAPGTAPATQSGTGGMSASVIHITAGTVHLSGGAAAGGGAGPSRTSLTRDLHFTSSP